MILSIETGGDVCSVALSQGEELLSLRESDSGRNHAEAVAIYIKEILDENSLKATELSAVAIGAGPGSYTGLRIGASVAKGICYAASLPLISVGSLESLVEVFLEDFEAGLTGVESLDNAILSPMLDARRMEVYQQLFSSEGRVISPVKANIITTESFAEFVEQDKFIIFGSGAKKCLDTLKVKGLHYVDVVQSARGVAKCAYRAFENGHFVDVAYYEPFYLKGFVAGTPKKLF